MIKTKDKNKKILGFPTSCLDYSKKTGLYAHIGIKLKPPVKKAYITYSEQETQQLAQKIGRQYQKKRANKSLIFILEGDLGTGKTQFAKGLARAYQIKATVVSPSFTLMREYPFQIKDQKGMFYHFDAWRLKKKEIAPLKIEKLLQPENVLVIEWGEKVKDLFSQAEEKNIFTVRVKLEHRGKNERKITVEDKKCR